MMLTGNHRTNTYGPYDALTVNPPVQLLGANNKRSHVRVRVNRYMRDVVTGVVTPDPFDNICVLSHQPVMVTERLIFSSTPGAALPGYILGCNAGDYRNRDAMQPVFTHQGELWASFVPYDCTAAFQNLYLIVVSEYVNE